MKWMCFASFDSFERSSSTTFLTVEYTRRSTVRMVGEEDLDWRAENR